MARKPKGAAKRPNIAVWIVLGLLVLALGGFGIGGFGGTQRTVATVGDSEVTVQEYGRALQQEQARLSQATGQPLTLNQLRLFGIEQQVMERLLAAAALDHEASELGVSVGDPAVAERIRAMPAFRGVSGAFDREAYAFALRNAGLEERDFEEQVRAETAAQVLQAAVIGGVEPPAGYAEAIAAWLAETRDVTAAEVTAAQLDEGATAPTEEALSAFYAENAERFETPERRRITYAWASPDTVAAAMEPDEGEIRALYEARADTFRTPRRVLAERLAFPDAASAEAAAAAIASGERTFEDFVTERGLTLEDVDQGELAEADLEPEVAAAVFGPDEPGLVGPVETPLGPALYNVNAVLEARETPLEEVRDDLVEEAAADAARRRIDAAREGIDDALAGGATLEELAGETVMELGSVAWDPASTDPIAGYEAFRQAAAASAEGDFPELVELSDGGLLAMRLDGIDPASTPPLDDVRAEVEAAWQTDDLTRRLADRAAALAERLRAGEGFEALGLTPETIEGIARDGTVEGVPPEVVAQVFEAAEGDVIAAGGDAQRAYVIRVEGIDVPDPTDPETAQLVTAIGNQARQELAADLFGAYGEAVRTAAGFEINQAAVQAVQAQLLGN